MIFTSYCSDEPFKSSLERAWQSMTVTDQVAVEDALQRWQSDRGPEAAHIYAGIDPDRQILARRVQGPGCYLVAVYDKAGNEIVAVSIEPGSIQAVIGTAFDYAGIPRYSVAARTNWTG